MSFTRATRHLAALVCLVSSAVLAGCGGGGGGSSATDATAASGKAYHASVTAYLQIKKFQGYLGNDIVGQTPYFTWSDVTHETYEIDFDGTSAEAFQVRFPGTLTVTPVDGKFRFDLSAPSLDWGIHPTATSGVGGGATWGPWSQGTYYEDGRGCLKVTVTAN